MIPDDVFLNASEHLGIRQESGDSFTFFDPADPLRSGPLGTWQQCVLLSVKILVTEARLNGGIPGMVFSAAQNHADGIAQGKITVESEEYAQQVIAMIQQLKAM